MIPPIFITSQRQVGFTLIELLLVLAIVGLMLSVSLPFSASLYNNYKASMKAEEAMIFISQLKRDSFLYSEARVLTSADGALIVDGKASVFEDLRFHIDKPIAFYRNGTTSGGAVKIYIGDQLYALDVQAPMGGMQLTRLGAL